MPVEIVPEGLSRRTPFQSVCRIDLGVPDPVKMSIGSGFLIAPDLVITAAHVVHDQWQNPQYLSMAFGVDSRLDAESVVALCREVLFLDEWHLDGSADANPDHLDVAGLRLDTAIRGADVLEPSVASDPHMRDVGVGVYGYPSGHSRVASVMRFGTGLIWNSVAGMVKYRAPSWFGHSGSPVLLEDENGGFGKRCCGVHNRKGHGVEFIDELQQAVSAWI